MSSWDRPPTASAPFIPAARSLPSFLQSSPNSVPTLPNPPSTASTAFEASQYSQKEMQGPSDPAHRVTDPSMRIQQEKPPNVSNSRTRHRSLRDEEKDIDVSNRMQDQVEPPSKVKHRFIRQWPAQARILPHHISPRREVSSSQPVESTGSERRIETIMGPPSLPRLDPLPARRPPSPSSSPSTSLPISLDEFMSRKESNQSISSRSTAPEIAPPVHSSRSADLLHPNSISSSLDPPRPATAPVDLEPIPSKLSQTQSHPSHRFKLVFDLPSSSDVDTSSTSQRSPLASNRPFSTGPDSEDQSQKRQRLDFDARKLLSGERVEMSGVEQLSQEAGEIREDEGTSSKSKESKPIYSVILPKLDHTLDRIPPPRHALQSASQRFFEKKDHHYALFNRGNPTQNIVSAKQSYQMLGEYVAKLRSDSSQAVSLLRHFAAYRDFCRSKKINEFPIVSAKIALALYDYKEGDPHIVGRDAVSALDSIRRQTSNLPIKSERSHRNKLDGIEYGRIAVNDVLDGEDLKRDLAEIEITPYSLLRRFENGKVERVLLPVDKPDGSTIPSASTSTTISAQPTSISSVANVQPSTTSQRIDLPQPGDVFPSEESLYCHTGVGLALTWGYSAIRHLNAASVQYHCTKGCGFMIKAEAVTRGDRNKLNTTWRVDASSIYDHTHDKREALVLDPKWRPSIRKQEILKALKQFDENGRLDDEYQVKRAITTHKKVSRFVPVPTAVSLSASTPPVKQPVPAVKPSQHKSASHILSSPSSDEGSAYSPSSASPEPAPSPPLPRQTKSKARRTVHRARAPSPELPSHSESKPIRTASLPLRATPPSSRSAAPRTPNYTSPDLAHQYSSTSDPDQTAASISGPHLEKPTMPSNPALPCFASLVPLAPTYAQPHSSISTSPAPSSSIPPPLPSSSSFFSTRQLPPHLVSTMSHLSSPLTHDDPVSIPPELLSFISSLSPSSTSPDTVRLIASILFRAGFDSFEAITEFVGFERETRGKVWEVVKLELGKDREICEVVEGIERRIVEGGEEGWMG